MDKAGHLVWYGDDYGYAPTADFSRAAFRDTIATTRSGSDGFSWRSTDPFVFVPALAFPFDGLDPALVKQARARALHANRSSVAVASQPHASSARAAYREVQIGNERFSHDSAEASLLKTMEKHGLALRRAVQARRTPMPYMSDASFGHASRQATLALLAEMPRGNPARKFIDELAPSARKQAFVSRTLTSLILGEEDMHEPRKGNENKPLRPLISEQSLVEISRLKAVGESIVLVQHLDSYGTSGATYGDLVAVSISAGSSAPRILRLASHHSDDDAPPEKDEEIELQAHNERKYATTAPPIERGPSGDGRALGLAYRPELVIELASPDRLLVTSRLTGATIIYAVPSLERLARVPSNENQGQLARTFLLTEKPYLLRMSALGSFSVQHVDKPELGISGRYMAGELVLFDRNAKFEMTDEAGQLLFIRVEGTPNLVPAEQFRAIAQKPGAIAAKMDAGVEAGSAGLAAPPLVEVQIEDGEYIARAVSVFGLQSLEMLLDGVPAGQVPVKGRIAAKRFSRTADSQGRWTTFVARDSNGVSSLPIAIENPVSHYGGKLRVIALGIDRYGSPTVRNLKYAASDAHRVTTAALGALKNRYRSVEALVIDDSSKLLESRDKDKSRELIVAEVSQQAHATGPRDTLLMFVSAHGLPGSAGLEIALPADESGALQRLPFSSLASALSLSRGRVFVLLDTCHAGGATHDAAVEQLTAINSTVAVIAASKGEQRSVEGPTWGGGVFSSAVTRAFGHPGRLGNKNLPGTDDLFGHIRAYVVDQTEGRQLPMLRVTRSVGPFALH